MPCTRTKKTISLSYHTFPAPLSVDWLADHLLVAGSVGHICSAATVAAASFSMTLCDPADLLRDVDEARYNECLQQCMAWRNRGNVAPQTKPARGDLQQEGDVEYVEPVLRAERDQPGQAQPGENDTTTADETGGGRLDGTNTIEGRVFKMGDFVDTDAVSIFLVP